jgi:hypothetical protein
MYSVYGTANGVAQEIDETAYLLHSPANRRQLLEAIDSINSGQRMIEVNLDECSCLRSGGDDGTVAHG